MRNIRKWFTLVELLVAITILAIISVVAYQSFGWVTSKAQNSRKIQDLNTLETSLNMLYWEKNHYPQVNEVNTTDDQFGYKNTENAQVSNSFSVTKSGVEIDTISDIKWGWKVMWIWTWASKQIWAKWTISQKNLGKQYLTKELYDIEIWDQKEKSTWKKLIEKWVGKYIYAVYNKWLSNWNWTSNMTWNFYNIAITLRDDSDESGNWFITKISWNYSNENCWVDKDKCPITLIWSWDQFLVEWQKMWKKSDWTDLTSAFDSRSTNQWIPYPVTNF